MNNIKTCVFNFQDEKTSKFWEISQTEEVLTVRYGNSGTTGQSQTKTFPNVVSASKHVQKLITEKLAKGYIGQGANAFASIAMPIASGLPQPKQVGQAKIPRAKAIKVTDAARDIDASPERLAVLWGKDDTTNRLLAKHPKASADLLEKLSHSSDRVTRQAVTANPNTPPETYVRLGQQFPKEFLANPALDLLLLMSPALMDEVPEALLVRLLKEVTCPASLLVWAGAKSSKKVQLAVSMNPRTPADTLDKLKESRHAEVVSGVTYRKETVGPSESEAIFQQEIRTRLGSLSISEATEAWKNKDIGLAQYHLLPILVQQAIAGADFLPVLSSGNIPRDTLDTLSKSQDVDILAAVAENPNTSPSALELIGRDAKDWQTLFPIADNPNTPTSTLLMLVDKSVNIKCRVARNQGLSSSEHDFFANDADNDVRRAYASNPKLSPARLEVLAKSQDPWICMGVACNPSSNKSTLNEIAKDKKYWVHLLNNPSADSKLITLIASDPPPHSLLSIASHPNTDSVILEKIIRLREYPVSNIAIRNKNVSLANLEALFNQGVYDLVASNQSTPTLILDLIAKIKAKSTHFYLARNLNSSAELLKYLSTSKDESVRGGVASNNVCPSSLLELLSRDQSAYVRWRVLANPNLTENIRNSLSYSLISDADLCLSYWFASQIKLARMEIKAAVNNGDIYCYPGKDPNRRALSTLAVSKIMALCSGPHVAPERIARLSVSTDWLIRAAAARNTATPFNLLNKLIEDVHPVVAALAKNNIELNSLSRNYTPFPIANSIKKMTVNKDVMPAESISGNSIISLAQCQSVQISVVGLNDSAGNTYLDGIVVGCTVNHAKFGQGIVLEREGCAEDDKVKVIFSNGKEKWLAIAYAKLALISS